MENNKEKTFINVETRMENLIENTLFSISGSVGKVRNDPNSKMLEIDVDISKIKLSDLIEYALRPIIIKNANNVRASWKAGKTFMEAIEKNPYYKAKQNKIVETLEPITTKQHKPAHEKLVDIVEGMNVEKLQSLLNNMSPEDDKYELFEMLLKMKKQSTDKQ